MAKKKRCGHKGRISRLLRTGSIQCRKYDGRAVEVEVLPDGNNVCKYAGCPCSGVPIPQAVL